MEGERGVLHAAGGIPGNASWMMWPVWHSQTAYEGAIAAGGQPGWSLARSAWAGSHLHNTIVWSGDISSTWQVKNEKATLPLFASACTIYM